MGKFSFGKKEKLCSQLVIEQLFANGQSFKVFPLRVIVLPVDKAEANAQILVSVPKKRVRSSPGRNRIKRLIRETYRLNKFELLEKWQQEEKYFAIGFIYLTDKAPDYTALNVAMKEVIRKLGELH
jgi:ribonuclease P protein component